MVVVSNDLGADGGSHLRTMVGKDMVDDVGDDVGDGDNGSNNAGNNGSKGDGRDAGRGGGRGLLAEDAVAAAAAVAATAPTAAAATAYCRGCLLFFVRIFVSGIFMMYGGNWQGHTSPHTLVTLEVYRRTFGW